MAHPDYEALLNVLHPFAQQMLEEYGEFHPFGAAMQEDGKISMIGAQQEGEEYPKAEDLIATLESGLYEEAEQGLIKASGICVDVRVLAPGGTEKTDAVQTSLEHREDKAVKVFLPYTKNSTRKVHYGDIFSCAADPSVFIPKILR